MQDNQQKQLFTELTPEEGAAVSGGAAITIHSIKALNVGADTGGFEGFRDDVFIEVNDRELDFYQEMKSGDVAIVNKTVNFTEKAFVELWDADIAPNDDDLLGAFTVDGTRKGRQTRTVGASGSKYEVTFSIT